jgi:hypothetical protein
MHPMSSRPRLNFTARSEKRQFHFETLCVISSMVPSCGAKRNISDCFRLWIDVNSDPRFFASLRMTTALQTSNRSPRIDHVSWGRLEVEGKAEPYKDAKVFPGGSREWNWRDTGTAHRPGIQIADVQELLDHGAKVVVLSRGMAECLHVPRETLEFLEQRQIAVHVLPTQHAVAIYNKLAQTEPVAGLFHTTC